MISKKEDLLRVAKRQNYYSTLAKKEGKDAEVRAKRELKAGMKESAKDSREEIAICNAFAKIRKKKAKDAEKKAGKNK